MRRAKTFCPTNVYRMSTSEEPRRSLRLAEKERANNGDVSKVSTHEAQSYTKSHHEEQPRRSPRLAEKERVESREGRRVSREAQSSTKKHHEQQPRRSPRLAEKERVESRDVRKVSTQEKRSSTKKHLEQQPRRSPRLGAARQPSVEKRTSSRSVTNKHTKQPVRRSPRLAAKAKMGYSPKDMKEREVDNFFKPPAKTKAETSSATNGEKAERVIIPDTPKLKHTNDILVDDGELKSVEIKEDENIPIPKVFKTEVQFSDGSNSYSVTPCDIPKHQRMQIVKLLRRTKEPRLIFI